MNRIIQVANILNIEGRTARDNPERGRVYDPQGIAPTLNTVGGGGREPKIVVYEEISELHLKATEQDIQDKEWNHRR